MAVSEKEMMKSNEILPTITNGETSIDLDLVGEQAVIPTIGAPTVNKFTSQHINSQSLVNDGTWEAVTLTVVWSPEEEETIRQWQIDGVLGSYTVTGYYDAPKTWEKCFFRVAAGASPVPGEEGYKSMQIEITCIDTPKKTEE